MSDEPSPDGDPAGLLTLLWGRRRVATRGPKAALHLDHLVAAGIGICDELGLDAVSMHAVAERVGYSKMSLYRHVASKDELLAVMTDAAIGAPPDIRAVRGGWRRRIEAYADALWQTWQQHPWLPAATVGARVMGPNEVAWVDQALGAFDGTDLDGDERIDAVLLVSALVRTTHSLATSGTFPWTDRRQLSPLMTTIVREHPDRFAAILQAVDSASSRPVEGVGDGLGLTCILDGLEKRISRRRRRARGAGPVDEHTTPS